jgi:hypothetical protein
MTSLCFAIVNYGPLRSRCQVLALGDGEGWFVSIGPVIVTPAVHGHMTGHMTGQFMVSHVRGGGGWGWWLIFNMWNEKHRAMVYSMSGRKLGCDKTPAKLEEL